MKPELFDIQKQMSLIVAKKVREKAVSLVKQKGATQSVIDLTDNIGLTLMEEIADDTELVVVLDPHQVDQYVLKILRGHVQTVEDCLNGWAQETCLPKRWIARLLRFKEFSTYQKFKQIVEEL